jgi:hypothetical protein
MMSGTRSPLQIRQHSAAHIVEVIYKPVPVTALAHATYTIQMKQIIESQRGAWGMLVDQRLLERVDDKLKDKMLALYSYAVKRRMLRSARVVRSHEDAQRLSEILHGTAVQPLVGVFTRREEAYDWLVEALRAR